MSLTQAQIEKLKSNPGFDFPEEDVPLISLEECVKIWRENEIKSCKEWEDFRKKEDGDKKGWPSTNPHAKYGFKDKPEFVFYIWGIYHRSPLPINEDLIKEWAEIYKQKYNKYPSGSTKDSYPIPKEYGISWVGIDSSLKNGRRGLKKGDGLATLLKGKKLFGKEIIDEIKNKAIEYKKKTGNFPSENTKNLFLSDGTRMKSLSHAFRLGQRGLDKFGTSLVSFFKNEFAETANGKIWGIDGVKNEIKNYIKGVKNRPSKSNDFLLKDGTSANSLNTALKNGGRGLPGGSSLSKLVDECIEEMRADGTLPADFQEKRSKPKKTLDKTPEKGDDNLNDELDRILAETMQLNQVS